MTCLLKSIGYPGFKFTTVGAITGMKIKHMAISKTTRVEVQRGKNAAYLTIFIELTVGVLRRRSI